MGLRGMTGQSLALKCVVVLTGFALNGFLGVLDYYTGHDLVLSALYVLPLALVTWFAGYRWGIATAFVSAGIWLTVDLVGRQHWATFHPWTNTVIMLVLFFVVAYVLKLLRATMARLEESTHLDSLTGALTSDFFYDCVAKELDRLERYGHPLTLAFLDLDEFKAVNDNFGHPTGDAVLRRVVDCAKSRLRKTDLVARLGGDEFGLLCPETDEVAARAAITELVARLSQEMRSGGWPVTFSIGVVTCHQTPGSSEELVKMADKLMYSVKLATKDGVNYETYGQPNGGSASDSKGVLHRESPRRATRSSLLSR